MPWAKCHLETLSHAIQWPEKSNLRVYQARIAPFTGLPNEAARSQALKGGSTTHEEEQFTIDVYAGVRNDAFRRIGTLSCQARQKNAPVAATS